MSVPEFNVVCATLLDTVLEKPENEWIVVPVEAIVDRDTYRAAQQTRSTKRIEKKNGKAHASPMLLTGLLKCGHCGSSLVAEKAKGGKYTYYLCARTKNEGKSSCPGHRLPAEATEHTLLNALVDRAFSDDNLRTVVGRVRQGLLAQQRPVKAIKEELEDVTARLTRYYDAFELGTLPMAEVGERLKELTARKKTLELEYQDRTALRVVTEQDVTPEMAADLRERFRAVFFHGPTTVIKQYLSMLVSDIQVEGDACTVHGRAAGVMAAVEQKENVRTGGVTTVRTLSGKWQPNCDASANFSFRVHWPAIPLHVRELRFSRLDVVTWLAELRQRSTRQSVTSLGEYLGLSRGRVMQLLAAA